MFFRACAGILEIEPTCGESEIRKAYFKKSKEYHPDKHAVSSVHYTVPELECVPVPLRQKVAVLAVPVPQHCLLLVFMQVQYLILVQYKDVLDLGINM
jgi:hypothetical protein